MSLTKKQIEYLSNVHWAERHFGSYAPRGSIHLKSLVEKGLVKSVGVVCLCDEDGGIKEPERYREGFVLTEDGNKVLDGNDEDKA